MFHAVTELAKAIRTTFQGAEPASRAASFHAGGSTLSFFHRSLAFGGKSQLQLEQGLAMVFGGALAARSPSTVSVLFPPASSLRRSSSTRQQYTHARRVVVVEVCPGTVVDATVFLARLGRSPVLTADNYQLDAAEGPSSNQQQTR